MKQETNIQLGLKENWPQFVLLVIVNAFVGGMVGMERSILPEIAGKEFRVEATSAVLSFIIVFGIAKAITNYFTGRLANRYGRKKLLIAGWVLALPLPFILMWAGRWEWIIAANVLLGIHQGLAWSSTVVMKIDLVGEKQRGFAMGLNEFAGYLAVALVAWGTSYIADRYGLRPYPFYLGAVIAVTGLLLTVFFVKETHAHAKKEAAASTTPPLKNIFWSTTWKDRNLGSVTQAGLINNLNDGMTWGLLPVLLAAKGFDLKSIGIITATYPAVWGIGQLITGKMADKYCKKDMLFTGMLLQGLVLVSLIFANDFYSFLFLSALLGWGTAMVYPTFLATIAEHTHPADRAQSLGVFRLWRDLGYAIGAAVTGLLADSLGISFSIAFIGILTALSAILIWYRMKCRDNLSLHLFSRKKSQALKSLV